MISRTTIVLSASAFFVPIALVVAWHSGVFDLSRWQSLRKIALVNKLGQTVAEGEIRLPADPRRHTAFSGIFRMTRVPSSRNGPISFDGSWQRYVATQADEVLLITLDDPNITHSWFGLECSGSIDDMTFTNNYHEGDPDPEWEGNVVIQPNDK